MKIIKVFALSILLILSTGLMSINNKDVPLKNDELTAIFPDKNLRKVIRTYFKNEDITISKLENLDGEFYASTENIEDLKGISLLKNIDSFIFCNNNINYLPTEILELNNLKSINLENNYITEKDTIDKLEDKNIKVDCDLNFIHGKKSQYELNSKKNNLVSNVNEKIDLNSLLLKSADDYEEQWKISNSISKKCDLYIQSDKPSILSRDNNFITIKKKSTSYLVVSLNKNKYPSSTVVFKITAK